MKWFASSSDLFYCFFYCFVLCTLFELFASCLFYSPVSSLLKDTSRGQELMEVVCKHLNLLETAYFGLRFVDKEGQTVCVCFTCQISFLSEELLSFGRLSSTGLFLLLLAKRLLECSLHLKHVLKYPGICILLRDSLWVIKGSQWRVIKDALKQESLSSHAQFSLFLVFFFWIPL